MRLILSALLLLPMLALAKAPASIAFYYGEIDSVRELMNYDRVVINPNLITARQLNTLHRAETSVFAYLSVGEFDGVNLPTAIKSASRTKNTHWQSHVMDLTTPAWQQHIIQKAESILQRGFDGLFLDTLDSYTLFAKSETEQSKQQEALTKLIDSLGQLDQKPKLILNRGFEVAGKIKTPVTAVVAESLYHSYHPTDNSYDSVKPSDTAWLKGKLNQMQSLGLEAIVIDYIPAHKQEAQKTAAQRLIDNGYTPYVSDGMLYQFGVSSIVPVPKRVLGFFDGNIEYFSASRCHRMMSMPMEYYGYVPECRDIHQTDFSQVDLTRYAGVFLWLEERSYQNHSQLQQWLSTVINERPLLFIQSLPTSKTLRRQLGIIQSGTMDGKITLTKGKEWFTKQYPATFSEFEIYPRWVADGPDIQSIIEVTDSKQNRSSLLIKAPWGGAILAPFPVLSLANTTAIWAVDPFHLIDQTLNLPAIPAADVTTESARRILTSHVDGDGFPSKAWFPSKPYTAEVLLEHVFSKFKLPQTVSVIEGEVGKRGLYPDESEAMEKVAREIFSLPHIEIASHTFSHPFFWNKQQAVKTKQYGNQLPIPGYTLDYDNEILGSINYINTRLAPAGKKAELLLWSGSANPTEDILNIAESASLLNVNGGSTYVVNGNSSLTRVSPTIAWYPSAVQVYAPVMNENVYTNLWTEHHDGYNRAIETFEILGEPRRLKSISIYYHMYSGAYPASLKSVIDAHNWALNQSVTPLYLSEYAKRAKALYETGLAKTLNGDWQITSSGIKSVRLPKHLGFPSIGKSTIAGWNTGPDGNYLILKKPRTLVSLHELPDHQPRLKSANGQLMQWDKKGQTIYWKIMSHIPLELEIANASGCTLKSEGKFQKVPMTNKDVRYKTKKAGTFSGSLACPK